MSTNVALFVLCVVAYVVASEILRNRRTRGLLQRLKLERNRNRFGELRTRLVRIGVQGKLKPRSPMFRAYYRSLTALMRNPHDFERAAQCVLTLPPPEARDAERPTKEGGLFARDFSDRLDKLCRDYSRTYAWAAWLMDRLDKTHPPLWLGMVAVRVQRRHAESVVAARERLQLTAKAAA